MFLNIRFCYSTKSSKKALILDLLKQVWYRFKSQIYDWNEDNYTDILWLSYLGDFYMIR